MKVINYIVLDRLALTKLPDLKDVIVTRMFNCYSNNLTSLEGAPKFVGGDFGWVSNEVNFTEEYVRSLVQVKGEVFV